MEFKEWWVHNRERVGKDFVMMGAQAVMPIARDSWNKSAESMTERIAELESAMQKLIDSVRKSMPDGYVDPAKEPDFVTVFKEIEQLLENKK